MWHQAVWASLPEKSMKWFSTQMGLENKETACQTNFFLFFFLNVIDFYRLKVNTEKMTLQCSLTYYCIFPFLTGVFSIFVQCPELVCHRFPLQAHVPILLFNITSKRSPIVPIFRSLFFTAGSSGAVSHDSLHKKLYRSAENGTRTTSLHIFPVSVKNLVK